jgi:hypothetical protein
MWYKSVFDTKLFAGIDMRRVTDSWASLMEVVVVRGRATTISLALTYVATYEPSKIDQ